MDRMLRAEIVATVRATMTEVLEGVDEVWLLPEELCKNFGMISKEWLNRFGKLLPREKIGVVLPDGTVKESRSWAYPKHKINRMIMEGKLKNLDIKKSMENTAKQIEYENMVDSRVRKIIAEQRRLHDTIRKEKPE